MQNPYNYSFDNTSKTYRFTTKNNIVYSIAFIEDDTLYSISSTNLEFGNMFQIVIEKLTDDVEPFDSQVFLTLDLLQFFVGKSFYSSDKL